MSHVRQDYLLDMKTQNKLLIFGVAAVIAAGAFIAVLRLTAPVEQVTYLTETTRLGSIRRLVDATGEVGAAQLVDVGAQASGQIKKLHVRLGQEVKKGELIAEIDSITQINDLKTTKAKLENYRAQLAAQEVARKIAKSKYDRETLLRKTDATSRENLETAESAYASAQASVAELQSQIVQAEIAVNNAETNLGYTRIEAPLDGTIVSVPVEEGQTVNANQTTPTIVQIADLTQMEIKIEIAEGDITKVRPGMEVSYGILSEPETTFKATLHSIDPGLTTLSDGTYGKSGTDSSSAAIYYYAKALVSNLEGRLRIGMTTQNSIVVAQADNVLIVPNIAVERRNGKAYINILLPNNKVEQREIVTGISDIMNVQVLSGLKEGEKVISSSITKAEADSTRAQMRGPF